MRWQREAARVVTIEKGETCRFAHDFIAQLLTRKLPWQQRNPNVRSLTLEVPTRRDGRPAPTLRIRLAWGDAEPHTSGTEGGSENRVPPPEHDDHAGNAGRSSGGLTLNQGFGHLGAMSSHAPEQPPW